MLIGSHVSFSKNQLLGSAEEALSYGANTFMFYTGAPQNTIRNGINENNTLKAVALMKENGMDLNNLVVHAPYIINLANNKEEEKYKFAIDFLIKEIKRCEVLGVDKLVLHPGSSVGIEKSMALKNIIYALNIALNETDKVVVCLETMAGKGSELGSNLEEIKTIIDGINKKELIGVCLDTCHLNDSGIDLNKFDDYLLKFDELIGINKIKVIHVNDSKNIIGSKKDRHEIIGLGEIGFDALDKIVHDERFESIPKILETPYLEKEEGDKEKIYPPYKFEISMFRNREFNPRIKEDIRSFYKKD